MITGAILILMFLIGCKEVEKVTKNTVKTNIDNAEEIKIDIATIDINQNDKIVDKEKNKIVSKIVDNNDLKVDKELIEIVYDYYRENRYELSMLPEFNNNKKPDRSNLATYIYLNTKYSEVNINNEYEETFQELFGNMDSEEWGIKNYEYTDDLFLNENEPKTGYFRVTDIYLKEDNHTYVIDLEAIFFAEGDIFESYEFASENVRAVRDFSGTTDPLQAEEFNKAIKEIFLEDEYRQLLTFNAHIEIEVTLDNDNSPFIYRACHIE